MSDSFALDAALAEYRQRVNTALEAILHKYADAAPAVLRESLEYTVMAPGKRLRPTLALMACEACGGNPADAVRAACAIELIHTYSLIHDDLPSMDDDELRRGRPTCHVQFGEANAILAGDALLTMAFEVIAADVPSAQIAVQCARELASAAGAVGMVAGQVADLEAQSPAHNSQSVATPQAQLEQLESIHHRKTGRLLSAALVIGARVAGADEDTVNALKAYGKCVGLAFQIADDLLDTTGDVAKIGKHVHKDSDHGKLTYPALLGVEQSRTRACELIDDACRHVAVLGAKAECLEALARFVIERDH